MHLPIKNLLLFIIFLIPDYSLCKHECPLLVINNKSQITSSTVKLCYQQNLPLTGKALLSEKKEHVIVKPVRRNRKLTKWNELLCNDKRKLFLFVHFNREVFQGIQLRTASEFNRRIQI